MAVQNTSIFEEVYLFSDTDVCAFSEGAFGEILASMRCSKAYLIYFRSGSCSYRYENIFFSGVQLNISQSDSVNNRTVKFVVACCVVFEQVEVSTILVSVKSTGSWLHVGTCPVFVR